jgi:hypothetical protein
MIKVKNKNQTDFEQGILLLKKIVEKRMNMDLFENPKSLNLLIEKSGGCIRDLFRLIADAAESAIDDARAKISKEDCESSIASLKKDYSATIADNFFGGKKIEVESYFNALVEVAKSSNKNITNTEEVLDLRQNLCILGYNGEGWCDVHPIVKIILKEKNLWNGEQN